MKSRNDFFDESEYIEYLRHYYAGMALNGILSLATEGQIAVKYFSKESIASMCVSSADNLIDKLFKK